MARVGLQNPTREYQLEKTMTWITNFSNKFRNGFMHPKVTGIATRRSCGKSVLADS